MHYVAKREDLDATANELFDVIEQAVIRADINKEYPLKDAVKAHEAIESGATTGASILIP
jgi:NADPH:quinone reductase-like Zn-dependent oxidoreductase